MDEGFYKGFTVASKINFDAEELMDLLFSRYSDMAYIMTLDIDWILDLIDKAIVKREEERLWDIYLVQFPQMTKENYVSFVDYKKKLEEPEQIDQTETMEEMYDRFKFLARGKS